MDIHWDYNHRKVHLLMLSYVTDALTRFQHANPPKLKHQPNLHINLTYSVKAQYAEAADVSPPLIKADKHFV